MTDNANPMHVENLRAALEAVRGEERDLMVRRYRIVLELETALGRGDGHEARFARAYLAADRPAMEDAQVDRLREYRSRFGTLPDEDLYRRVVVGEVSGIPVTVDAAEGDVS